MATKRWKDVKPGFCFFGAVSGHAFLLLGKETIPAPNNDPSLRLLFLVSSQSSTEFVTIYRSIDSEVETKDDKIVQM